MGMPFEQRYIAGEVVTGFRDRLANMISKNEGIRQFSILTNTAYNADVPFADTQQTRIRITNSQHDISQLDKTYITVEFEAYTPMEPFNAHFLKITEILKCLYLKM